jgi:hypothetical protein
MPTGAAVGPARHHEANSQAPDNRTVWTVVCDPLGQIWSGGDDEQLRKWALPRPVKGPPRAIRLEVQVRTGMEFDARQAAQWLDATTWDGRRQELMRLGQPVLP